MKIKTKLSDEPFSPKGRGIETMATGKGRLTETRSHQQYPLMKRFGNIRAGGQQETLIQPRAVALAKEHIHLLKYLEMEGEADLLPTTGIAIQQSFKEAENGIEKSKETGRSMLKVSPS